MVFNEYFLKSTHLKLMVAIIDIGKELGIDVTHFLILFKQIFLFYALIGNEVIGDDVDLFHLK